MRKKYVRISAFGYENKERYPIHASKNAFKRYVDSLFTREESKRHYTLFKDFNTVMCNHTLHRGRRHFCCYCLQAFRATEILESHVNDRFEINGKEIIKPLKKGEYVRFKKYERKIK